MQPICIRNKLVGSSRFVPPGLEHISLHTEDFFYLLLRKLTGQMSRFWVVFVWPGLDKSRELKCLHKITFFSIFRLSATIDTYSAASKRSESSSARLSSINSGQKYGDVGLFRSSCWWLLDPLLSQSSGNPRITVFGFIPPSPDSRISWWTPFLTVSDMVSSTNALILR